MKRPLTRTEKWVWRPAVVALFIADVTIVVVMGSALYFFFTPKIFHESPIACFARPSEPEGTCDIETFTDLTTKTVLGDFIPVANPVSISIHALVISPAYNKTGESYYFGYVGRAIWGVNPYSNETGCFDKIPVGTFELYPNDNATGVREKFKGSGTLCFSSEGQFSPVMLVGNGTGTTTLFVSKGWNADLSVEPPGSIQNYNFNSAALVFGIVLAIFGILESVQLLLDIYPKAFPYRVEHPSAHSESGNASANFKDWMFHTGNRRKRDSKEDEVSMQHEVADEETN